MTYMLGVLALLLRIGWIWKWKLNNWNKWKIMMEKSTENNEEKNQGKINEVTNGNGHLLLKI